MLSVGSLFSGVGGIDLGLERTGGFKVIWNCEVDDYASAVLRKHWPDVPNVGDITQVDWATVERPDLLCGGFPCQDISDAGRKKGLSGKRSGLWKHFFKCISFFRPKYVVVENVSALVKRGLCSVLADFAQIGYDAEWTTLSAKEVGAPHKRERLFILAYPHGFGCGSGESNWERGPVFDSKVGQFAALDEKGHFGESRTCRASAGFSQRVEKIAARFYKNNECWKSESGFCGLVDGVSEKLGDAEIKCYGNAVVPACAQVIGEAVLEMEKDGWKK